MNNTSDKFDEQIASLISYEPDLVSFKNELKTAFSLSDFVVRCAEQYPEQLSSRLKHLLAKNEVDNDYETYISSIIEDCQNEADLHKYLRITRQVCMAEIAVADLLSINPIEKSLKIVSFLADCLINTAYYFLYESLSKRYGYPREKQHMQILAMGKLGGQELNFSSDIDLIFAYPFSGETDGSKKSLEHQQFFTKLAQKLIAALDQFSQYGRVYRVDMRLRPHGDSGALVMPYSAFEHYYLDQGREWERFAMQKMRIVNLNEDSSKLLEIIRPFVYRKYIDFTTIESIRGMKQLIENEVRRKQLTNNIKLGAGGIREAEFYVQSLQLIHAGRHPDCQSTSWLESIQHLYENEFIEKNVKDELQRNYLFLRRIEQYLQIFNDEQTQTLPDASTDQWRLCQLLNLENYDECLELISSSMSEVHSVFSGLIDTSKHDESEKSLDDAYLDIWKLDLAEDEALSIFSDNVDAEIASFLFEQIIELKQKIKRSALSAKGGRSIDQLMPYIISEICEKSASLSDENSRLFSRNCIQGVFEILNTVLGRPTYLDLLYETPDVRQRLYLLCGKSSWVAKQISKFPILLDELLHPNYLKPEDLTLAQFHQQCADELRQFLLRIPVEDVEAQMDALRQFKHAYQLRIAAADISKTLPINKVSDRLTILAEVILAEVVEQAWHQTSQKFGKPELETDSKGLGIIAYGKFGGIELSYGSDLDIVFIYDAKREGKTDDTGSRKSVSHQEFYIKLVQRISHLCTTQTYNGILYDIDLRLRPSGKSGLLISQIDSYEEYQKNQAWTWEHQALSRARIVFGDSQLRDNFERIRKQVLQLKREHKKLLRDIVKMREKMRQHIDKSDENYIDVKQCHGGIVDIEFAVQYLVLLYSNKFPEVARWSDNLRILDVCKELEILSEEQVDNLQKKLPLAAPQGHRMQLIDMRLLPLSKTLDATLNRVLCNSPIKFELDD